MKELRDTTAAVKSTCVEPTVETKQEAADTKVKVYLEMNLDRLDKHTATLSSFIDRNADYTVKILELEYYSQKLLSYLHQSHSVNIKIIISLNLILDPLWDISEEIFSIFGELDSIYSELVLLSSENKTDFDFSIKKLNELKNRPTYIRIRCSESINAGRSLIASLKEHCFRLLVSRNSFQGFKAEITNAITEILNLSKENISLSKSWVSGAFTHVETIKYKAEDALEDLFS